MDAFMEAELKKSKAYETFKEYFSSNKPSFEIDLSDEDTKQHLIEWFYETRQYDLDEYFTGRVILFQLSASARRPVSEDSDKYDVEYTTKFKNFVNIKVAKERVKELEQELFFGNEEVIDILSSAKKEALFKAIAADADKGSIDLWKATTKKTA